MNDLVLGAGRGLVGAAAAVVFLTTGAAPAQADLTDPLGTVDDGVRDANAQVATVTATADDLVTATARTTTAVRTSATRQVAGAVATAAKAAPPAPAAAPGAARATQTRDAPTRSTEPATGSTSASPAPPETTSRPAGGARPHVSAVPPHSRKRGHPATVARPHPAAGPSAYTLAMTGDRVAAGAPAPSPDPRPARQPGAARPGTDLPPGCRSASLSLESLRRCARADWLLPGTGGVPLRLVALSLLALASGAMLVAVDRREVLVSRAGAR